MCFQQPSLLRSANLDSSDVLLGMALAFFGISITLDLLEPRGLDPYLFEDGAKLAGIVSWLSYFSRTGAFAVRRHMTGDTIDTRSSPVPSTSLAR